jgi:hypothetical protein
MSLVKSQEVLDFIRKYYNENKTKSGLLAFDYEEFNVFAAQIIQLVANDKTESK